MREHLQESVPIRFLRNPRYRCKSKNFIGFNIVPVSFFSHTKCGKIATAKSEKRAFLQMSEAIHREQESRGTFRSSRFS